MAVNPESAELADKKLVSKRIAPLPVSKDSFTNTTHHHHHDNHHHHQQQPLNVAQAAEKQLRDELIILTNTTSEIYSTVPPHQQHPCQTVPESYILSEQTRLQAQKNRQPYVPVKVHVSHRPTNDDVGRIYNPYSIQSEYEKYVKYGFIFEPLNVSHNASSTTTGQQHDQQSPPVFISSQNANNMSIATTAKSPRTTTTKQATTTNPNIAFSSEAISPYARPNASQLQYRNPVGNDKLLDHAKGYTSVEAASLRKANYDDDEEIYEEDGSGEYLEPKVASTAAAYNNSSSRRGSKVSSQEQYQDEYDLANKMVKRSNPNLELVNSINKELKRIKTGYQPDASQA